MTSAFDRPNACSDRVAPREPKRLAITARIGAHRPLRQHSSSRRCHDRERVLVAMRVDTDHVVHLLCEHPDRSSVDS
jgi:hypothetical protein